MKVASVTDSSHRVTEPLLAVSELGVTFRVGESHVRAVKGLSFDVNSGETLAIVGESGSGKSVSAAAVMGVLPPGAELEGSIRVRGRDVLSLDEKELLPYRASTAAMIFQDPVGALSPHYTIGRQLEDRIAIVSPSLKKRQRRNRAIELLHSVRMQEPEIKIHSYPFQISGGQAQRVIVAMALAGEPELLIADEPTTALDVTVQAEILNLLRELVSELEVGLVLITHDMGVVADLADRVLVMRQAKAVEMGDVRDVFASPSESYTRELLQAVPRLGSGTRPSSGHSREVLLSISNLKVSYEKRRRKKVDNAVLHELSLELHRGETMGIVGESGSGKSTLGQAILGFAPIIGGSIRFDGHDLASVTKRRRTELLRSMGVVFQNPSDSLDPRMTVFELVAEPLRIARNVDERDVKRRVSELLERVDLGEDLVSTYVHEISGGQRQRVAIARALTLQPKLVVADEPTSALDVSVQKRVLELFAELQEDMGFSSLFISHDLAVVEQVCDRVLVLEQGMVHEISSVGRILNNPRSAYTRHLVAASPVPDPDEQYQRRIKLQGKV